MRYRAFISYSHHDRRRARQIHRALETYSIPKRLIGAPDRDNQPIPRKLGPIFLDRAELSSGASLSGQVNAALADSGSLIVLCSPAARASVYVESEIQEFRRLGRQDRILAALVNAGIRGNIEDALPRPLRDPEPLLADLDKDGFRNAKLKLVAGMLGIGFDELKQRDAARRRWHRIWQLVAGVIGVLLYVLAVDAGAPFLYAQRIDRFLDQHELSISRPAPSQKELERTLAKFRGATVREVVDELKDLGNVVRYTDDGRMGGTWELGQMVAGIAAAPEATPENLDFARRQIEIMFVKGASTEVGGVNYGWLWFQLKNPQAEAALWPIIALSELLKRDGGVPASDRQTFQDNLHYAERGANLYFTPGGGWDHLPRQQPAEPYALYTTLDGLNALLAVRDAGQTWWDDRGADVLGPMTSATFHYLLSNYAQTDSGPGWRPTGQANNKDASPQAALTLLAYALLLRASDSLSSLQLPDSMLIDMASRVRELSSHDGFDTEVEHLTADFIGPDGRVVRGGYEWQVEWLPCAVAFAAAWAEHLQANHAPNADVYATRRLIDSLLAKASPVESKRGDFWRAELLYRLAPVRGRPDRIEKAGFGVSLARASGTLSVAAVTPGSRPWH